MDDPLQLSAETLKALQEFLQEQATQQNDTIPEDWQLSQFWYDEATTSTLTSAIVHACRPNTNIALISCPTLYPSVKSKIEEEHMDAVVKLFEYDKRFAKYKPDFVFYDYNEPLNIEERFKMCFDIVVADPPFLSEECLRKTSETIQYMKKVDCRVIVCTGAVMERLAGELLNLRKCAFEPRHKNNLGNEFVCMTNFGDVTASLQ